MGKFCLTAALALTLSGCVSANSQMLDDRTAMISARGTGFDNTTGVVKKLLTEAATMAQARGYEYFQIVDSQDQSRAGVVEMGGGSWADISCSAYSCSGEAYSDDPAYIPYVRPGADVLVRFWRTSEVTPAMKGMFRTAAVLAQAK